MDNNSKIRALEAALFIYGEPMEFKKIAALLDIEMGEVKNLIEELDKKLVDSGLSLVLHDSKAELVTKPEFGKLLEDIVKEELSEELTPASLETLAIISYLGPVPRSKVDYIRGVNSTFILRHLLLRGLVERSPDPNRSNVFLYRVSFDMLRHLGLAKVDDLPEFQKYRNFLEKIEESPVKETKAEDGRS